jgi:DNA-binding NtrC family response regulator
MHDENGTILIVDDEADIRWVLRRILEEQGHRILEAANGREGLSQVEQHRPDLILIDLRMPLVDGMQLLKTIRDRFPDLVAVILTAHGDVGSAVEAIKMGAFDFLVKPVSEEIIRVTVRNGLDKARLIRRVEHLEGQLPHQPTGRIIGHSLAIRRAIELVDKVAPTDLTVLLVGESGTGKELFAHMIHQKSSRRAAAFIAVDGGAFPETLAESELFGYEKGAFTGADKRKIGKFELAHEGTLFLDEIGNMTLDVQAKILRAIEQKKIYRVGGRSLIPIDARVISATNADLEEMVRKDRFREDLYYRLNAFTIEIPPLRARQDDLPLLIDHFMKQSHWGSQGVTISNEAMELLLTYDWPGNIRELKNTVERAILICSGIVVPDDLPPKIRTARDADSRKSLSGTRTSLKKTGDWGARLEEEKAIREILEKTGWNRAETAMILEIDVKTLYNKMKKYNIHPY